jgi:hypothetical protein
VEWGCKAGVHSSWFIVDLSKREEAILMDPPEFRQDAVIVELNQFTKTKSPRGRAFGRLTRNVVGRGDAWCPDPGRDIS